MNDRGLHTYFMMPLNSYIYILVKNAVHKKKMIKIIFIFIMKF